MPTLNDILAKIKEAKKLGFKDKDIKVAAVKAIIWENLKPTKKQQAEQAVKGAISTTKDVVTGKTPSTIGRDVIVGAGKGVLQLGSLFPGADIGISPEQKRLVTEPTSTGQKVGAFITRDVLPTIAGSGVATKGISALASFLGKTRTASQITRGATGIAPFLGGATREAGKTLEFLTKSAATTGVATGVTRGELPTTGELGAGLGIDILTGGIGKILKNVAPMIFQLGIKIDAPKFQKIDEFARIAPGKFIGTKRGIVQQADDLIKISGEQLDDLLSPFPMKWERANLVESLSTEIKNTLDAGFDTEARAMQKFMDSFLKSGKTKNLNAKDLLKLKRDFASRVARVFESGKVTDPTVAARKQAVLQIWKDIDTILNSLSLEVKELNELMSLGYAIGKPLSKELKKGVRINLIDLMGSLRSLPITPAATTGAALSKVLGKTLSRRELSPFFKTILSRPNERAQ